MRFYLPKRKERIMDNPHSTPRSKQLKDNEKEDQNKLFRSLYDSPMSLLVASIFISHRNQIYMVIHQIHFWIKTGKPRITSVIKCKNSGYKAELKTTHPNLFPKPNQFKMDFGYEAQ